MDLKICFGIPFLGFFFIRILRIESAWLKKEKHWQQYPVHYETPYLYEVKPGPGPSYPAQINLEILTIENPFFTIQGLEFFQPTLGNYETA